MCPVSTAQRVSCVVRCSRSPPAGCFWSANVNILFARSFPPYRARNSSSGKVKDKICKKGHFSSEMLHTLLITTAKHGGGRKEEGPKSARRWSREACRMQGVEGSMGTHQGRVQEEARTPTCARARWKFSSGQIQARCYFSILLIENVSPWDAVWCSGSATLASTGRRGRQRLALCDEA